MIMARMGLYSSSGTLVFLEMKLVLQIVPLGISTKSNDPLDPGKSKKFCNYDKEVLQYLK